MTMEIGNEKALQKIILKHIKENGYASYPELQDIFCENGFDYKGNLAITNPDNENIIFWTGWNREAAEMVNRMEKQGLIKRRPASKIEILLSGGMLRLPLVTGNYDYKKDHWLPIVFYLSEVK